MKLNSAAPPQIITPITRLPKTTGRTATGLADNFSTLNALDLQKTFDNVKHEAVLRRISRLHLGLRTFVYVKSFLTGRTAEIRLGEDVSPTFRACVGQGTPQGAVLAPLLFNFAMMDLPEKLAVIPAYIIRSMQMTLLFGLRVTC